MTDITQSKEFEIPDKELDNSLEIPLGIVNFADTKQMIFKSFIQLPAYYKNVPIIFKTLNDNELFKIKALSGIEDSPKYTENLNIYYFLYSIYMVDGINVLINRDQSLRELRQLINNLPPKIYNLMLNELFTLSQRVNECVKLVERYSFEPDSRWLWYALKGKSLASSDVSGVRGTDTLGYNVCQLLWEFFNQKEDEKNDFERLWTAAKLVASAINPKGIKKLNQADDNRRIEEQNRRESIIYGRDYKPKFKIQSKEELVDELEKQMTGDKDKHDQIIEQYLKRQKLIKLKDDLSQQAQLEQYKKETNRKNLLIDYDQDLIKQQLEQRRNLEKDAQEALKQQRNEASRIRNESDQRKELNQHFMSQQLSQEDLQALEDDLKHKYPAALQNMLPPSALEKAKIQHTQIENMLGGGMPRTIEDSPQHRENIINPDVYLRKFRKRD